MPTDIMHLIASDLMSWLYCLEEPHGCDPATVSRWILIDLVVAEKCLRFRVTHWYNRWYNRCDCGCLRPKVMGLLS